MRTFWISLGFFALAVAAFAADVDGKWKGTVNTPMGDFPVAFTFKADGAALNGSMTGMDGAEIPIKEGKIDGANLSFSLTLNFGDMPFQLSYKGVLDGDEIKFTGEAAGMPFEFSVKRDK